MIYGKGMSMLLRFFEATNDFQMKALALTDANVAIKKNNTLFLSFIIFVTNNVQSTCVVNDVDSIPRIYIVSYKSNQVIRNCKYQIQLGMILKFIMQLFIYRLITRTFKNASLIFPLFFSSTDGKLMTGVLAVKPAGEDSESGKSAVLAIVEEKRSR